jgi:hypothetical protein
MLFQSINQSINQNQIDRQGSPSFFVCYSNRHHRRHHHILFSHSDISDNVHLHTYSGYSLFCPFLLYLAIRLYIGDSSQYQPSYFCINCISAEQLGQCNIHLLPT